MNDTQLYSVWVYNNNLRRYEVKAGKLTLAAAQDLQARLNESTTVIWEDGRDPNIERKRKS